MVLQLLIITLFQQDICCSFDLSYLISCLGEAKVRVGPLGTGTFCLDLSPSSDSKGTFDWKAIQTLLPSCMDSIPFFYKQGMSMKTVTLQISTAILYVDNNIHHTQTAQERLVIRDTLSPTVVLLGGCRGCVWIHRFLGPYSHKEKFWDSLRGCLHLSGDLSLCAEPFCISCNFLPLDWLEMPCRELLGGFCLLLEAVVFAAQDSASHFGVEGTWGVWGLGLEL